MNPSRSKKMEYDPETGCYRRIVPLDFAEQKVEDIVQTEMKKSRVQMKLSSDKPAWKQAEDKEHGSNPDSSLEDLTLETRANETETTPHYISGDSIKTEYKFTTKEEIQTESSPGGEEKNGEFADEEIRKAGEAIKAKFDEDRMKFEHDSGDITMSEREMTKRSYERRRRSSEDDPDRKKAREDAKERSLSLEKKIKDMEERRARMLRRSSGDHGDNDDTNKITRTITTETSHGKSNEATGSVRDESRSRRARMREERNRRRLASEGLATETKSDDQSKATPVKSAGVKLELRSSSDSYLGHDDASDITFTVKEPAEKKRETDSGEEKITSYTKTTKTVSLSGSLLDEPNVQSHTQSDDITFTVKESAHKKDGGDGEKATAEKPLIRDRVQEEEVKIAESEPVHSRFAGDFTQEEPEDIVFTVKKTTTTTAITSAVDSDKPEEPPKSATREITLEERSFNPKTDLISWDEDVIDSGDKPLFRDYEPRKKREQVIADSSEYKGSLGRTELSRDHERRRNREHISGDSTDGYRGSLGRTDLNRVGSNKGRNDLPPVILHDIESDFHEEQPVEPQKQMQVESTAPDTSPMEEFEAPILLPHYQDKSIDDERRKRQREIEEKQRQIMEKQQRASVKRREIPGTNKKPEDSPVPASSDNTEDLQEKRRSLLMMWESFAEGEGPGPENKLDEEERRKSFGYDKMMIEASQSDALNSAGVVDYRTMDVEEENEEQRTPIVDIDEHHKLNDDELKWERAGQFQPGRLKTKFHELNQDDEPSADNIVFETKKTWQGSNNNTDESSSSYSVEQRYSYQAPVEEDQSYTVESAAKPLWGDVEDQSTHKDDDDDEEVVRRPHVDVDKENRLTEEEVRWERAGHFQPGKINTSIFEARKTADQNERVGLQKFKKSETRSYEQIKKIQRTDSKKEMLVPKKVALQASDNDVSDVMEQDEYERPEVGKIDKSNLVYETMSDEEGQRREREERNRREMEEIQREREEERRRLERDDREAVTSINDFEDDEFDAKVKAKNVRKIDISKFGDFQKSPESVQENRPVSKLSTKRYSSEIIESHRTETVESTPTAPEEDDFELKFKQEKAEPEAPLRKSSLKKEETYNSEEVVTIQSVKEVESIPDERSPEEEYELKRRSVGRLNMDWMSQMYQQDSKDSEQRRKETEMQRVKQEQYEIEKLRMEEMERRQLEGDDVFENEVTDVPDKPQNVKPLDTNTMSAYQKRGKSPDTVGESKKKSKDEVRQERKLARKESRSKMNVDEVLYVEEMPEVEQSPESFDGPQNNVGKLDKGKYLQMMGDDMSDKDRRKKQLEEERVRRELEEMEKQREEEERRMNQMNTMEEWSDVAVTDKPQSVNKLDLNQFSQFQQKSTVVENTRRRSVKKSEEIPNEKEDVDEDNVRQTETIQNTVVQEVHSAPYYNDEIIIEEKPKNVGKLDFNKITKSFSDEAEEKQRRMVEREKERIRRENEERELLLLEQQRQRDPSPTRETEEYVLKETSLQEVQSAPGFFDDEEKQMQQSPRKSVGKLDFNKITKSFSDEAEEKRRRLVEMEKERIRRENEEKEILLLEKRQHQRSAPSHIKTEDHVVKETTVQEVHSAPTEFDDDDEKYEEKPKKSVGKLDFDKITKSFSEEAEEKRRRLLQRERERIIREKEERELLLLEEERQRSREATSSSRETEDYVVQETTVQEVHSAPTDFDEDADYERKRKTSIGKLDFNKITKSFSEEADEKRRRLVEMEKNRIRRESEERELLLREQGSQREERTDIVKVNTVQEVQSVPENFDDDDISIDDKPKTVGKLDFEKITKSFSSEAEEKRRRLVEMEKERIRRESEEREIILLEKQHQRQAQSSQKTEDFVVKETTVEEVHSAPTDFDDDEKYEQKPKKSVGKLDFDKITKSFGEEAEENRRRLLERERERIRREKEEKDILLLEQQRQSESSSSVETQKYVVDEVQSTPNASETGRRHNDRDSTIDREREEQYSVEEKRKSVSKLNIGNIMQSFREEDDMKKRRAMELDHDRRLRDEEEKNLSRLERQRANNTSSTVKVSVAQEVQSSASEDIFFEEKETNSKPDLVRKDSKKSQQIQENHTEIQSRSTVSYEYDEDDGASQNKMAVGRLDLQRFSQSIDQETRERERRGRELESERLRLEREEMEGRSTNQSSSSESSRADGRDDRSEGQSEESDGYSRPVPKRLDLSKFSAFQGGLRVTKDDTAVKRRNKSQGRQVRPKSIAGTSFKGVANGDAAYVDIEYRIVK